MRPVLPDPAGRMFNIVILTDGKLVIRDEDGAEMLQYNVLEGFLKELVELIEERGGRVTVERR